MIIPAAIAHGGADSDDAHWDGPQRAVDAALNALERGEDVVDAAIAATKVLEDDPRFNAGTGSKIRLDGESIQLDASLMHSSGRFGAVAALERVKNPILVAREVFESPHLIVVGDGATRLARRIGLAEHDVSTDDARASVAEVREALLRGDGEWAAYDWRRAWNYDGSLEAAGLSRHTVGTDTVGCCVRDAHGNFAAALSTGGTSTTLRGRVGDVPILGAGLYASPSAAVACTGDGERILEASLALRTHDRIVDGLNAQQAADTAVDGLRTRGSIGILVLTSDAMAAACGSTMAWAGRNAGSAVWFGPASQA
ncbi:MAG: isoaspartyl peptidase/L-asparaginase [Myxococcales bacterium]|nr:isoaspartyl peptidase/L-asparaginase [Myxococcales bacterium]